MNQTEIISIVAGTGIAIAATMYYKFIKPTKRGSVFHTHKGTNQVIYFDGLSETKQKKILDNLSNKELKELSINLEKVKNNDIISDSKLDKIQVKFGSPNKSKTQKLISQLLDNKSHSGENFINRKTRSKKTGDQIYEELREQNEKDAVEIDTMFKNNSGKGKGTRKRKRKHRRH